MSDWAVGDLAVCVDAFGSNGALAKGNAYIVLRLSAGAMSGKLILRIGPTEESGGWYADRFRKVLPDKHEACESEFVDLLKRSKVPTETIVTVDRDGRAWMEAA